MIDWTKLENTFVLNDIHDANLKSYRLMMSSMLNPVRLGGAAAAGCCCCADDDDEDDDDGC